MNVCGAFGLTHYTLVLVIGFYQYTASETNYIWFYLQYLIGCRISWNLAAVSTPLDLSGGYISRNLLWWDFVGTMEEATGTKSKPQMMPFEFPMVQWFRYCLSIPTLSCLSIPTLSADSRKKLSLR